MSHSNKHRQAVLTTIFTFIWYFFTEMIKNCQIWIIYGPRALHQSAQSPRTGHKNWQDCISQNV